MVRGHHGSTTVRIRKPLTERSRRVSPLVRVYRTPGSRRRRTARALVAVMVVAAVALVVFGAVVAVRELRGSPPSAEAVAARLASALGRSRLDRLAFTNTSSAAAGASLRSLRSGMHGASASVSVLR